MVEKIINNVTYRIDRVFSSEPKTAQDLIMARAEADTDRTKSSDKPERDMEET